MIVTPALAPASWCAVRAKLRAAMCFVGVLFLSLLSSSAEGMGILPVEDQVIPATTNVLAVPLTLIEDDKPGYDYDVTADCSDAKLLPPGNFTLWGYGSERTLLVTPVPGRSGSADVRVRVSDGTSSVTQTFKITVQPGTRQPHVLWATAGFRDPGPVVPARRLALDVKSVQSSAYGTAFIRKDGSLWLNEGISPSSVAPGTLTVDVLAARKIAADASAAAVGGGAVAYVAGDGTLRAFGARAKEIFGKADVVGETVVVDSGVKAVALGSLHAVYLKKDGTLWAIGDNYYGQLGNGTTSFMRQQTPVQIAKDVTQVSASGNSTFFLKKDGTLWAAGQNKFGQLGDGTTTDRPKPVKVVTKAKAVAAGAEFTLFLKKDGTVWGMGRNNDGQLGDGTLKDRKKPIKIATKAASVAAGGGVALFTKTDGSLWRMGRQDFQKAFAAGHRDTKPQKIAEKAKLVAAGTRFYCYTDSEGVLWVAGNNDYNQLGTGHFQPWVEPVDTGVVKVATGSSNLAYLRSDGQLWLHFWKDGRYVKKKVTTSANVAEIARSGDGTTWYYRTQDGRMWRLGLDGVSTKIADDTQAIAAGYGYYVFIKTDGSLWGRSDMDHIRFGKRGSLNKIADDVRSVAAGHQHILFVKRDRTLWGMGTRWSNFDPNGSYVPFLENPEQLAGDVIAAVAHSDSDAYLTRNGDVLRFWSWSSLPEWGTAKPALFTVGLEGVHLMGADGKLVINDRGSQGALLTHVLDFQDGWWGDFAMIQQSGAFKKPTATRAASTVKVNGHKQAVLRVNISGPQPINVQWFKDGKAIPGATSVLPGETRLIIPVATSEDRGVYTVQATNAAGTTTSSKITLKVVGPPTITAVASQKIKEDKSSGKLKFKVADEDTSTKSLKVTATSSDPKLVPPANIVVSGTGASRTVTFKPAKNQSGTAVITLTVSDGKFTTSTSFKVTVKAVNDAPTITKIADQSIRANSSTKTLTFTIGDVETKASKLKVTVKSSNTALVKATGIKLSGSSAKRKIKVTPLANKTGTAKITITVSDGKAKTSTSFKVKVTAAAKKTAQAASRSPLVLIGSPSRIVKVGSPVEFSARPADAATFVWRRDGQPLPNQTSATLGIASAQLGDAGGYSVTAGGVTSSVAELIVAQLESAAAPHGSTMVIQQRLIVAGAADSLVVAMQLPAGWTYLSGSAPGATASPATGENALLEWHWKEVPAQPVEFTAVLRVPLGTQRPHSLDTLVRIRHASEASDLLFVTPLEENSSLPRTSAPLR